eukprot:GEZU01043078.1.p1 GENE.GEZU01043078.1~~GEZU01043078.1.p1  ORF type:complete len:236 (-),score=29.07 GEZU01043078.1:29-703(-)
MTFMVDPSSQFLIKSARSAPILVVGIALIAGTTGAICVPMWHPIAKGTKFIMDRVLLRKDDLGPACPKLDALGGAIGGALATRACFNIVMPTFHMLWDHVNTRLRPLTLIPVPFFIDFVRKFGPRRIVPMISRSIETANTYAWFALAVQVLLVPCVLAGAVGVGIGRSIATSAYYHYVTQVLALTEEAFESQLQQQDNKKQTDDASNRSNTDDTNTTNNETTTD